MAKWYEFNNRDRVRVARKDDEFCKNMYLGHVGEIVHIHYGGGEWSVGETRTDPYAIVKFANGKANGFFVTELDLVSKDMPLTTPVEGDGELVLSGGDK